jgi:hypothetical protein
MFCAVVRNRWITYPSSGVTGLKKIKEKLDIFVVYVFLHIVTCFESRRDTSMETPKTVA